MMYFLLVYSYTPLNKLTITYIITGCYFQMTEKAQWTKFTILKTFGAKQLPNAVNVDVNVNRYRIL